MLNLTQHIGIHWPAITALCLFGVAYVLVICEEFIDLPKSKPVVLAAGMIWALIAFIAHKYGVSQPINQALKENLTDYAELFLFLLVAMTYINAMEERHVFLALQGKLLSLNLTYRALFWITGVLAFFISPFADNLTTALIMCAVLLAVGKDSPKFISLGCIHLVVAANAGGAFSPFGDITTLMVWQSGQVAFSGFFNIFLPSVVSFLIPAAILSCALPAGRPQSLSEQTPMRFGAKRLIGLFLLTILTAIIFHNFLHLPPAIGMMTGLGYLQFYGFYLKKNHLATKRKTSGEMDVEQFDVFRKIQRAEWDTLLFFYGVILCVGGLAALGLLTEVSEYLYQDLGASLPAIHQQTPANVIIGLLSAVVDNIPIMFAVLTMNPQMSEGQWLLVTLTAGIGGSLLSVGSAAGVALMGQARGLYTFFSHLKWSWAVGLGYIGGIATHLWWNQLKF